MDITITFSNVPDDNKFINKFFANALRAMTNEPLDNEPEREVSPTSAVETDDEPLEDELETPSQQPELEALPTSKVSYTLDDLVKAANDLIKKDPSHSEYCKGLNAHFGIVSLPKLSPDKYGEYACKLRERGADI